MSRCWALALRCGKFVAQQVVELLWWARPLVVLYNMSVAGVRVVEFGTYGRNKSDSVHVSVNFGHRIQFLQESSWIRGVTITACLRDVGGPGMVQLSPLLLICWTTIHSQQHFYVRVGVCVCVCGNSYLPHRSLTFTFTLRWVGISARASYLTDNRCSGDASL